MPANTSNTNTNTATVNLPVSWLPTTPATVATANVSAAPKDRRRFPHRTLPIFSTPQPEQYGDYIAARRTIGEQTEMQRIRAIDA